MSVQIKKYSIHYVAQQILQALLLLEGAAFIAAPF